MRESNLLGHGHVCYRLLRHDNAANKSCGDNVPSVIIAVAAIHHRRFRHVTASGAPNSNSKSTSGLINVAYRDTNTHAHTHRLSGLASLILTQQFEQLVSSHSGLAMFFGSIIEIRVE